MCHFLPSNFLLSQVQRQFSRLPATQEGIDTIHILDNALFVFNSCSVYVISILVNIYTSLYANIYNMSLLFY